MLKHLIMKTNDGEEFASVKVENDAYFVSIGETCHRNECSRAKYSAEELQEFIDMLQQILDHNTTTL